MSKSNQEVRPKRKNAVGMFFFGQFMGFLITIALIVGICAFAYFKVSPKWLNDTFHVGVDLGSEDANKLTLSVVIPKAVGIVSNLDTYSMDDLKSDFGIDLATKISDSIGLDISDLSNVGLTNLPTALQEKFEKISINELGGIIDLSGMSSVLDNDITYYVSGETLYRDYDGSAFSNPIDKTSDFEYTISSTATTQTIKIGKTSKTIDISDTEVSFKMGDVPIAEMFNKLSNTLSGDSTLGELESFGFTLPSSFDDIDRDTKLNQLESAIQDMYVASFLNLDYDTTTGVVTDPNNGNSVVSGVLKIVATKKVSEMNDIANTLKTTQIAEILGYTVEGESGSEIVKDGETEVTGLTRLLALKTLTTINDITNEIKLSDLFSESDFNSGVLSLINKDTLLSDFGSELSNVFTTKTLDQLIMAGLVSTPDGYNDYKDKSVTVPAGTKKVSELLLGDLIDISWEAIKVSAT